jgi:hypothetical protein
MGEDYVSHKRLTSLVKLNQINDHGWLDLPELTAAYRQGNFAAMLESLGRKVYCIGKVLELYLDEKLSTGASSPPCGSPLRQDSPPAGFFHCLRAAVGQTKSSPPREGTALPAWVSQHFRGNQYKLLRALWGCREVSIGEIQKALYGTASGHEDALDKVKDRTNRKLATLNQRYEITTRRGEVYALLELQ